MRIAYLACRTTLPGSPNRQPDAFEHDQMMACLHTAAKSHRATVEDVAWDTAGVDWGSYDAVLIGTAWDYQDRLPQFLSTLEEIALQTRVFNSPELVAWNAHKKYLRELQEAGLPTVPSVWLDDWKSVEWEDLFRELGARELVVKRQVGASAVGQYRVARKGPYPDLAEPMVAQPYLKSIETQGERSLVFVAGELSHGLTKLPAEGDYRIQSLYGGTEKVARVSPEEEAVSRRVLESLPEQPLYARVDLIEDDAGEWRLMELELIEPFLYPLQGPQLGENLVHALRLAL